MSAYKLKKLLMLPYTGFMSWRHRDAEGFIHEAMKLHYYRPAFMNFIRAHAENPELLLTADLDADSVVFDVGAYDGSWARDLHRKYGCRIYAFEPDPRNFARLAKVAAENPDIIPLPYGLADSDQSREIYIKNLGSSLFFSEQSDRDLPKAEVELRTPASVMKELGIDKVQLMKINIEGSEFPLLEHMLGLDSGAGFPEIMNSIETLNVQFHEWHPGAYHRYRNIVRALNKTHQLNWHHHFIWEQWRLR